MKKIFFIAIAVFASFSLHAQGVYFGGSLRAWQTKADELKMNTINFYPEVGYSFAGNWHAGVAFGFGHTKISGSPVAVPNVFNFNFTPYAGYTFYQNEIAALFVEGALSFTHSKPKGMDATNGFEIGLNPGISISLAKNLSMRAHFGFLGYQKLDENHDAFGIRFDAESLRFGFHYSF